MVFEFLTNIINSLVSIIKDLGYLGIFIGMAIESSFFPLPSEIILIPAGALVAKGEMNFFYILIAGVLGSLLGALINYSIALHLGRRAVDFFVAKYGKFLFITKNELEKTELYFKHHGEITTFLGRLVFVMRHLISIPAGFSRMNIWRFSIFTLLGSAIWCSVLILIGMLFGSSNVDPAMKIATGVLLILSAVAVFVYYSIKVKRKPKKTKGRCLLGQKLHS